MRIKLAKNEAKDITSRSARAGPWHGVGGARSVRGHLDLAPPLRETFQNAQRTEGAMMTFRMLSAFLAAAFALAAGPVRAEMKTEWVEYGHGDVKLKAYMAYDDKVTGKRPAILMIHARDGMSQTTLQHAEIWAKLGYVSFAADIY